MKAPKWKTVRRTAAVLVLLTMAGCSTPPYQQPPAGGTNADTGQLVVDDIWVNGPKGLPAGGDAPLQLDITNESATAGDTLVGVSTPIAQKVVLRQDGHVVSGISLPPSSNVDLEWQTGIQLQGLRQKVAAGQYVPVTLTFAQAAPITTQVVAGPLAAPEQ